MKIIKKIKELFLKNYRPLEDNHPLVVQEINYNSDRLSESLGITDKRDSELQELIHGYMHTPNATVTIVMVLISKECKHANELAYCSFVLRSHIQKMQNPLSDFFSKISQR